MKKQGRLVIVSNRLPVNVVYKAGAASFDPSAGGLATGLSSFYRDLGAVWVGWPGSVPKEEHKKIQNKLVGDYHCHPVFLPDRLVDKFYEGFSNKTLWPLFHSFQSYMEYSASEWKAYQEANQLFSDVLERVVRPGDRVWIHDYQLMLLPHYLRKRKPSVTTGFFLHIPFPHHDIFRLLPQSRQMLAGVLGADLIGFHSYDYAQAFLGSVRRLLGYDNNMGRIIQGSRVTQTDVFPMGIDFQKFVRHAREKKVLEEVRKIRQRIGPLKLVFSVSRLDYTKGIPNALEAMEEFLERHPEWRRKVVFLLVVVPSREGVGRYASLKRRIDELVGRINSRYGKLDWTPIRYVYRFLSFEELVALYAGADTALITPLRDGMNLVAKEFLACKSAGRGVLILSEMTGVAKELLESLIVNPNSKEEVAGAIYRALTMPEDEQSRRLELMRRRLKSNNVRNWAEKFLSKLSEAAALTRMLSVREFNQKASRTVIRHYRRSARRLILLDYDGTVVPYAEEPAMAQPAPDVLEILKRLSKVEGNTLALFSGRDRNTLEKWFGGLDMVLAAEYGAWVKDGAKRSWILQTESKNHWKEEVRPFLQTFVDRIPNSFIEEKTFSLVWHYRKADQEIGPEAARELVDTLMNFAASLRIEVLTRSKAVEFKVGGVSKASLYPQMFLRQNYDFILAMGDDWTDEQLFHSLPKKAYCIRVGFAPSVARWHVSSPREVEKFLGSLLSKPPHHSRTLKKLESLAL